MLQLFAYAAQEHSAKYGSTLEQCAKIAYKNHKHSIHNPHASLRNEIPLKRISESRMICKPITLFMSSPTADGSAAAVVCSRDFMESRGMQVCVKFSYEHKSESITKNVKNLLNIASWRWRTIMKLLLI